MFALLTTNLKAKCKELASVDILEKHTFRELGGHYVAIAEAISLTMAQLRIKVPNTALAKTQSIRDVLDLFEDPLTA
jgi:hypothetical protein